MADRWIDVDIDGDGALWHFLTTFDEEASGAVYDLLDDLRKRGEYYIRLYAPSYSGELLRRIGSSVPTLGAYADGGEEWEASAGVLEGDRHPLYVHGGTGIYRAGRLGASQALRTPGIQGYITSLRPGKPMTFQKRGEPRKWKMWVTGQKPNPFVLYAYQQLVPYARGRIRRLFSGVRRP